MACLTRVNIKVLVYLVKADSTGDELLDTTLETER